MYTALRQRLDVDEGPGDLLDPVQLRTADGHRLLQTVRSAVPEVHAGNVRTFHVVPGRSRQSKTDFVLTTNCSLVFVLFRIENFRFRPAFRYFLLFL